MRRMYITPKALEKYNRTPGCEACDLHQGSHSEHCRARIEKLMIEAGDAFKEGILEQQDSGAIDAVQVLRPAGHETVPSPPPDLKRQRVDENVAQAKLDGDGDTVMNVAGIVAAIRDKIDEPYIELSGEYWAMQNFPQGGASAWQRQGG